jgi:hypothetical protein
LHARDPETFLYHIAPKQLIQIIKYIQIKLVMVSQNEYPFDEGDTGADGRSKFETSISIALVVLDEDGCRREQLSVGTKI